MSVDGTACSSPEVNLLEAALRLKAASALLEHAHNGECDEDLARVASDDLIGEALRWAHGPIA